MHWFDAHLDLAYLAVCGRDMTAAPDVAGGPDLPGCVTLPSLAHGNVKACLGTVFTEVGGNNPASYADGDAPSAHGAGLAQIATYQSWAEGGAVSVGLAGAFARDDAGSTSQPRSPRWGEERERKKERVEGREPGVQSHPWQQPLAPLGRRPLRVGILVECADPITDPEELSWWVDQGVVAVGLAWAMGGRYSGGNGKGEGLTDLGRDMINEMDRLKVTHDVSHLSDLAMDEIFDLAQGQIMASHSNCREVVKTTEARAVQRHLTDKTIRKITRRGGMIGLNLYSPFLATGGVRDRRATITEAIDHVDHVCQLAGNRGCVGLGSDMDGGFSALKLPEGIDGPADLPKLADELRRRGWPDSDIHAFAWGNWARFWGIA
jgi:membrane dipeptidase